MGVSKRRTPIEIQSYKKTGTGDYGDDIYDWKTDSTVWAELQLGNGREFWEAQKINSEISGLAKIPYQTGIKADMRVKYGSRIFELIGPPVDIGERHVEMELKLKEVF